eukprot:3165802-Rhodomonas_salina.1
MSILKYAVMWDVAGWAVDSNEFRVMLDKVQRAPAGYLAPNHKWLFCVDAPVLSEDPKPPKQLPNTLHEAKKE